MWLFVTFPSGAFKKLEYNFLKKKKLSPYFFPCDLRTAVKPDLFSFAFAGAGRLGTAAVTGDKKCCSL